MGFVFMISYLVILYRDDYTSMFGDLNIVRFILLVLIFVVSIIFLIISPASTHDSHYFSRSKLRLIPAT